MITPSCPSLRLLALVISRHARLPALLLFVAVGPPVLRRPLGDEPVELGVYAVCYVHKVPFCAVLCTHEGVHKARAMRWGVMTHPSLLSVRPDSACSAAMLLAPISTTALGRPRSGRVRSRARLAGAPPLRRVLPSSASLWPGNGRTSGHRWGYARWSWLPRLWPPSRPPRVVAFRPPPARLVGLYRSCRRFSRSHYLRLLWSSHTSSNVSLSGFASLATVSPRASRAPRSTSLMVVPDTPLFSASSSTVSSLFSLIRRNSRPNRSSLTPPASIAGSLLSPPRRPP